MKRLRLASDEIAIPIRLDFPKAWGTVITDASVDITVPDFRPQVDVAGQDPADARSVIDVQLPGDGPVPTPYDNSPA